MPIFKIFFTLIVGYLVISCTRIKPDGDEIAVVIKKPFFFGHGGIDSHIVDSGLAWGAITTSGIYMKKVPFQLTEHFDDLITFDNQPVDFDAYIELQIIKEKAPELISSFGEEWYANKIQKVFRGFIRDYAKSQKMFSLTTDANTLLTMQKIVFEKTFDHIQKEAIPVKVIRVSFSKVSPPKEVLDATIKTAAEIQRRKTEHERGLTEKVRAKTEKEKAKADNAYRNTLGLNSSQYLEFLALENERLAIESGKANITILKGGSALPTFNIK